MTDRKRALEEISCDNEIPKKRSKVVIGFNEKKKCKFYAPLDSQICSDKLDLKETKEANYCICIDSKCCKIAKNVVHYFGAGMTFDLPHNAQINNEAIPKSRLMIYKNDILLITILLRRTTTEMIKKAAKRDKLGIGKQARVMSNASDDIILGLRQKNDDEHFHVGVGYVIDNDNKEDDNCNAKMIMLLNEDHIANVEYEVYCKDENDLKYVSVDFYDKKNKRTRLLNPNNERMDAILSGLLVDPNSIEIIKSKMEIICDGFDGDENKYLKWLEGSFHYLNQLGFLPLCNQLENIKMLIQKMFMICQDKCSHASAKIVFEFYGTSHEKDQCWLQCASLESHFYHVLNSRELLSRLIRLKSEDEENILHLLSKNYHFECCQLIMKQIYLHDQSNYIKLIHSKNKADFSPIYFSEYLQFVTYNIDLLLKLVKQNNNSSNNTENQKLIYEVFAAKSPYGNILHFLLQNMQKHKSLMAQYNNILNIGGYLTSHLLNTSWKDITPSQMSKNLKLN